MQWVPASSSQQVHLTSLLAPVVPPKETQSTNKQKKKQHEFAKATRFIESSERAFFKKETHNTHGLSASMRENFGELYRWVWKTFAAVTLPGSLNFSGNLSEKLIVYVARQPEDNHGNSHTILAQDQFVLTYQRMTVDQGPEDGARRRKRRDAEKEYPEEDVDDCALTAVDTNCTFSVDTTRYPPGTLFLVRVYAVSKGVRSVVAQDLARTSENRTCVPSASSLWRFGCNSHGF